MFPDDDPGAAPAEPSEDDVGPSDPATEVAEPDPEAGLPDPENELPAVPDPPAPSTTMADAPPDLLRAFWTTVLVLNVALLALSVGAMMVAFDVHRSLGAAVLVVGLLSLVRGVLKYRALDDGGWQERPD